MNQLIETMTNADYHATAALSSSGLRHLAQSPAHYRAYKENPPEQTKELMIGSAVHAGALENGLGSMVIKAPGSTRATKLYKDFAETNSGKILLLEDEYADVERICEAIAKHPTASALLSHGKAEVSAFWTDKDTGIECKCRPDYLRAADGLVIDLKTTQDASPDGFRASIGKYKYHWQTAWYLEGLSLLLGRELENFIHIAVEKVAPYGIGIYVLDNGSIEKAREDIQKLKGRFAECLHTGEWPIYAATIQNIAIPSWAFEKEIA